MKFSEYLKEEQEVNLIGKTVNGKTITHLTPMKSWNGDFNCGDFRLTSLGGAPKRVNNNFDCTNNDLTSLEDAPEIVLGYFWCSHNKLTSLEGAPKIVKKGFECESNNLITLKGAPREVGANFSCDKNKLTNLKDIHKIIPKINGAFYCWDNPIKSHVLGLLLIDGLESIYSGYDWDKILNKYFGKGRKGLLDCQNELMEAGYEELAQI